MLGRIFGISFVFDLLFRFSMLEKKSGEFIGNIELMDVNNSVGELGIAITAAKQNTGYGTEAVSAITEYGTRQLGLNRVFLRTNPQNTRAIHVYQKCGFKEYGRRRKCRFINGKYYDNIEMDILAEEFEGDFIKNKNV